MVYVSEHKMVSVCLHSSLPDYEDKAYVRADSRPSSVVKIMEQLPPYITTAKNRISDDISKLKFGSKKQQLMRWLSELKKYYKLNIFGFNSGM